MSKNILKRSNHWLHWQLIIKADGSFLLFLFRLAHFFLGLKHAISTRWLANPHQGCNHIPHNFWSSYDYLIHFHVGPLDSIGC